MLSDNSKNYPKQHQIEALFNAMGDKTRRQIFYSLMKKNQTIKELAVPLGISITAVSQHIKILEASNIVLTNKIGRERNCELNPKGFETLNQFVEFMRGFWSDRFMSLKMLLEEDI